MLSFFRKLYKKEQVSFADQFAIALVKRKQMLADAFQKGSKKFSRRALYFFLAGFCICFGTAFIRIAVIAIKGNHPVIFADPPRVIQPRVMHAGKDYVITQRQRRYIHNLKEYLDSLKRRHSMGTR